MTPLYEYSIDKPGRVVTSLSGLLIDQLEMHSHLTRSTKLCTSK